MSLPAQSCRFIYILAGWALGWTVLLNLVGQMSAPVLIALVLLGALLANELTPPIGTARTRVRRLALTLLILSGLVLGYMRFGSLLRSVI